MGFARYCIKGTGTVAEFRLDRIKTNGDMVTIGALSYFVVSRSVIPYQLDLCHPSDMAACNATQQG